jgi:hypothetical protein
VTDAVLVLAGAAVADGSLRPGDLPALAGLLLPDTDGDLAPAAELVLPGSPAARLLDEREVGVVDTGLLARWGAGVLQAVGVAASLVVLRVDEVPLDAPPDEALEDALDGVDDWLDDVAALTAERLGSALGAVAVELVAVRDLDLVRGDAWPEVLGALAADPALRAALLTPVRVHTPGGGTLAAPSYTAWWLRERFADGGAWADPDAEAGIAALLPAAPPELASADPAVRAVLGGVRRAADLDAAAVADVLDGLADPDVVLDAAAALRTWAVLATLGAAPPDRSAGLVRVLEGDGTVVVDAELDTYGACVVGDPMHAQRDDLGGFVVAPGAEAAAALADLLDLPMAVDLAEGDVDEAGARQADVPAVVHELLPGAPRRWCEHDDLRVDGAEVDWWVDGDGLVHAATLDALARGLAWAAGAWGARSALAEVLLDPASLPAVLLDEAFSGAGDA